MLFNMQLNDEPFTLIKSQKKLIEVRLFDDKRRLLNINDRIVFRNRSNKNESVTVVVKALYRYSSFLDLFSELPPAQCGFVNTVSATEAALSMRQYYSETEELHYGVVGIRIKVE